MASNDSDFKILTGDQCQSCVERLSASFVFRLDDVCTHLN